MFMNLRAKTLSRKVYPQSCHLDEGKITLETLQRLAISIGNPAK